MKKKKKKRKEENISIFHNYNTMTINKNNVNKKFFCTVSGQYKIQFLTLILPSDELFCGTAQKCDVIEIVWIIVVIVAHQTLNLFYVTKQIAHICILHIFILGKILYSF